MAPRDLPSPDMMVSIGNATYALHSEVLRTSILLRTKFAAAFSTNGGSKSNLKRIHLNYCPGGYRAFDMVARCMYSEVVNLTPDTILPFLSASRYLKLDRSIIAYRCDPEVLSDIFLNDTLANNWRDCFTVLSTKHKDDTLEEIDDIVEKCEVCLIDVAKRFNASPSKESAEESRLYFFQLAKSPEGLFNKLIERFRLAQLSFIHIGCILASNGGKWLLSENKPNQRIPQLKDSLPEDEIESDIVKSVLCFLIQRLPVTLDALELLPCAFDQYLEVLLEECEKYVPENSRNGSFITNITDSGPKRKQQNGYATTPKGNSKPQCISKLRHNEEIIQRHKAKQHETITILRKKLAIIQIQPGNERNSTEEYTPIDQVPLFNCVNTIKAHNDGIFAICASPDGIVWTGGFDRLVKGWKKNNCFAVLRGHTAAVRAIVLEDEGILYSASEDCSIKIWKNTVCRSTLKGHTEGVCTILLSQDGSLWSGGFDNTIKQWNSEYCLQTLHGHKSYVYTLDFAPNGLLVSGSRDKTLRVWREGHCLHELTFGFEILKIYFTSDNLMYMYISSSPSDNEILLFKLGNTFLDPVFDSAPNTDEGSPGFETSADSAPSFAAWSQNPPSPFSVAFSPPYSPNFLSRYYSQVSPPSSPTNLPALSCSGSNSGSSCSSGSSFSFPVPDTCKPWESPKISWPTTSSETAEAGFTPTPYASLPYQTSLASNLARTPCQDPFAVQEALVWVCRGNSVHGTRQGDMVHALDGHSSRVTCVTHSTRGCLWSADSTGYIKQWRV